MEIRTTFLSYEQGLSRKQKPYWKFTTSSGKEVLAFQPPIAQQAISLIGKPLVAEVTEKPSQNPQYPEPSYFLDSVRLEAPAALTGQDAWANHEGSGAIDPSADVPIPPGEITKVSDVAGFNPYSAATDPKQAMIVRQSSMKTAVELLSYLEIDSRIDENSFKTNKQTFQDLTDELSHYALTGEWATEDAPVDDIPWDPPTA